MASHTLDARPLSSRHAIAAAAATAAAFCRLLHIRNSADDVARIRGEKRGEATHAAHGNDGVLCMRERRWTVCATTAFSSVMSL